MEGLEGLRNTLQPVWLLRFEWIPPQYKFTATLLHQPARTKYQLQQTLARPLTEKCTPCTCEIDYSPVPLLSSSLVIILAILNGQVQFRMAADMRICYQNQPSPVIQSFILMYTTTKKKHQIYPRPSTRKGDMFYVHRNLLQNWVMFNYTFTMTNLYI